MERVSHIRKLILKQENCGKCSSTLDNFKCNLVSTPTRLMYPKFKLDHQFLFTHLSLIFEILIYIGLKVVIIKQNIIQRNMTLFLPYTRRTSFMTLNYMVAHKLNTCISELLNIFGCQFLAAYTPTPYL
jgi:hypothetical protein